MNPELHHDLARLLREHPTARIVSDVGASLTSGWGELQAVTWHEQDNVIELVFA